MACLPRLRTTIWWFGLSIFFTGIMAYQLKKIIDLEEGWGVMLRGITKLKNILKDRGEPFDSESYMMLYTYGLSMTSVLRSRRTIIHKEALEDYLKVVQIQLQQLL